MGTAIDFLGYRYDDAVPAFLNLSHTPHPLDGGGGSKFVFHRATMRVLDSDALTDAMTAAGYTPAATEIGDDLTDWLADHTEFGPASSDPVPPAVPDLRIGPRTSASKPAALTWYMAPNNPSQIDFPVTINNLIFSGIPIDTPTDPASTKDYTVTTGEAGQPLFDAIVAGLKYSSADGSLTLEVKTYGGTSPRLDINLLVDNDTAPRPQPVWTLDPTFDFDGINLDFDQGWNIPANPMSYTFTGQGTDTLVLTFDLPAPYPARSIGDTADTTPPSIDTLLGSVDGTAETSLPKIDVVKDDTADMLAAKLATALDGQTYAGVTLSAVASGATVTFTTDGTPGVFDSEPTLVVL